MIGLFMIYAGVKKMKNERVEFELKHLFKNISFSESSGTQLIIEGIFLILSGLLFYVAWFKVWPA
jgi:hypothetical protein